jgi:hypothetical protein
MTNYIGTPRGANIAISDMLDHCAKVQPGQEVLILSEIEGLYGGDSMVDQEAVSWIQTAVQARGAHAAVLWIDEPVKAHAWRFPPVVKAAMSACDILINHSFTLVTEEMTEFRDYIAEKKIKMVRNFAATAPLLCTAWAQTPYELVSEIRHQASLPFKGGTPWKLTDDNGTHLEGIILDPASRPGVPGGTPYSATRDESGYYLPWPEWVHPPIRLANTTGVFIFDCMLSWWSRYIGISPYFSKSIQLTIKNNRITDIKGGDEADALRRFLASMINRVGDEVYDFNALHSGVHPQARVAPHQCPNILFRRTIEHSHSSNIHFHIGAPPAIPSYNYWMHCTGDIRTATFRVGDTLVHDRGHLTFLEHPAVLAVAKKYPGRPGLTPEPRCF